MMVKGKFLGILSIKKARLEKEKKGKTRFFGDSVTTRWASLCRTLKYAETQSLLLTVFGHLPSGKILSSCPGLQKPAK